MEIVAVVTVVALLEYQWLAFRCGRARGQYGVEAPAVSGHEIFERHFRVQQNTLEQLVVFLPALWLAARFANPLLAAGLGVVFIVGRLVYATSYVRDPSSRGTGFLLTFVPNVLLLLAGLVGAVLP